MTANGRQRFAVVGAGIAGLACARTLREAGAVVSVFEQDAFPGGRAATLIEDAGPYDHGAQYFTAEDDAFATAVRQWEADDIVQRWRGRIVAMRSRRSEDKTGSAERFVAVPGMRRLGVHMAKDIDVRYSMPIAALVRADDGWYLRAASAQATQFGPFDAVCIAVPSDLAAALAHGHSPLAEQAQGVHWDPCWAVMVALAGKSGADFEGAFINDDPILGWAALDSAKPRRGKVPGIVERWVLHAKPSWSSRYFDMDPAVVARWLLRSFSARLQRSLNPVQLRAVRWPRATVLNPLPNRCLWDPAAALGMAGDWCEGPSIEGAYLSGVALAEAALG